MTQKLSRAIVRAPAASFVSGLTRANLGPPNYQLALRQHAAYCDALESCGLTLTHLETDERFPDSTFVEDTAVMILCRQNNSGTRSHRAVITRPGAASRRGEEQIVKQALAQLGLEILEIASPGTVDGGDVCETDDRFFIGISERTNEAGAGQLAEILSSSGYTYAFIDIRGHDSILHLKSGLAYLGDKRLVVIDALATQPAFHDYGLIKVERDEEYAANCVRVNDHVLVAAGFPRFERSLQDLGYKTLSLQMSEFQKLDGGLSCLSLRF
ncbi:MAG TPA: arginine deiminase family protein [Pyrinomonadaceae bacterium]|jgi:dimethylargininase